MEKIAFLFPGQGSQFVGMGKTFFYQFPIARQTFEEADDTLGFNLSGLCFEGRVGELMKTENTQVALLTVSMAAYRVYMQEIGVAPQFCAGHSLGEYAALACAGALKFADTVSLMYQRGLFSKEIVDQGQGTMTIVDGLEKEAVAEECRRISNSGKFVGISCFNGPNQVAISGHPEAVQAVEEKLLDIGAQVTPLIASPPFHCPLMAPVTRQLKEELLKYTFYPFKWPVISNISASPYGDKERIIELLINQLVKPVQWEATMKYFGRYGVTLAIEMGPQNIMSNLVELNRTEFTSYSYGQKEERKKLAELFEATPEVKKHIPTVITKCLQIASATPNNNWNQDQYQNEVNKPYRRIQEIQEGLEKEGKKPDIDQMKETLDLLRLIFATKKLPVEEQKEWFFNIFDETGTNYVFADFKL
jgi:[acyl-carrier-protein] S-malonyltransferase